jgi:predicted N-acetyltransferase YhbS
VNIRLAEPGDLDAALGVMSVGFGSPYTRPSVHTLTAEAPEGRLLVAEREDGTIVGTAGAVSFGQTAWVGGVAVLPEARGVRLGEALTAAALDAIGEHPTVLLLATAVGRPIYERLGFVPEVSYRVFNGAGHGDPDGLVPAPPELVRELDREATGEDRRLGVDAGIAAALATPDHRGVALRPPWAARPILARDPAAGRALLAGVMEPGIRLAAPVTNRAAIAAILSHGCPERPGGVIRMRRGAPVDWRPDEVWSVFSLFFG